MQKRILYNSHHHCSTLSAYKFDYYCFRTKIKKGWDGMGYEHRQIKLWSMRAILLILTVSFIKTSFDKLINWCTQTLMASRPTYKHLSFLISQVKGWCYVHYRTIWNSTWLPAHINQLTRRRLATGIVLSANRPAGSCHKEGRQLCCPWHFQWVT